MSDPAVGERRYATARVVANERLAPGHFVLHLSGCAHLAPSQAGQFIMVRGAWGRDPLLPRAFSVLEAAGERAAIYVKAVGRGTRLLEAARPGAPIDVLGPLGTPLPGRRADEPVLLVGGGVGVAPLALWLARHGARAAELLYGGRTAADLVLRPRLDALSAEVLATTEDGSAGRRGRVTAALADRLEALAGRAPLVLACGPNAMLDAVGRQCLAAGARCFLCLEAEMACGVGACLGCAVAARSRPYRYVCVDGPVFEAAEVIDPAAPAPAPRPGAPR